MYQYISLQLFLLVLVYVVLCCEGLMPQKILLLGGNGMLGGETAVKLVEAGHQVHVLNRGNWYHDSATRIKPFVKHIKCDRYDIKSCQALIKEDYFDVVVDFSSYMPGVMEDFLTLMQGKFDLYLYISSDSVYEVCQKPKHNEPSQETDSIRPFNLQEREKLNEADSYGHNKLACEEVLTKLHTEQNFNFVSLRLPDVIGPRDNTNRFWYYFLWTLVHKQIDFPLMIVTWLQTQQLNFVYSLDVANLITKKLIKPAAEILNQPFNLACPEDITLQNFLTLIGNSLNVGSLSFIDGGSEYYFPSVTRGPINCTKAIHMLEWNPTPINVAINDSIAFYRDYMVSPQSAVLIKTIVADLETSLIPKEKAKPFRDELSKHTKHVIPPKEEL